VNHLKNAESLRDCCDKIKKSMFVNIGLWPYEHNRLGAAISPQRDRKRFVPAAVWFILTSGQRRQLFSLRQVFPYNAREIWVLIRGAGTFVDVTPFEFRERKAASGDQVKECGSRIG
jgi:hypothetical protein